MEFEWDEAKRQVNLAKHGVEFLDAAALFDGRPVVTVVGRHPDEPRFLTTGELDGRFYPAVWTWRGDAVRLRSARRARDAERRAHRSRHGGRD